MQATRVRRWLICSADLVQAGLFDAGADALTGACADNSLREPLALAFDRVPDAWRSVTDPFIGTEVGQALAAFVDRRVQQGATVYPRQVLRALEFDGPETIRVVILGQDPYHGPGQAQGLAFSVAPGQKKLPPSLRNLLREVATDTGLPSACRGDLSPWAAQGVLLLNSVLTVEDGAPQSHAGRGWELLTDALLCRVAKQQEPVVFMLWGAAAQRKLPLLEQRGQKAHGLLIANHPSPLSARRPPIPFVGCRHFSKANAFIAVNRSDAVPIQW